MMNAKMIKRILERAENWPERAQADLARVALEIEMELQEGTYTASPDEVAGIERGLREAAEGKFATESEVEAVLVKYRR
jgi:predicted transcriptional regulator